MGLVACPAVSPGPCRAGLPEPEAVAPIQAEPQIGSTAADSDQSGLLQIGSSAADFAPRRRTPAPGAAYHHQPAGSCVKPIPTSVETDPPGTRRSNTTRYGPMLPGAAGTGASARPVTTNGGEAGGAP